MDTLFAIIVLIGTFFYLKSALGRWIRRKHEPSNYDLDQSDDQVQSIPGQKAADEFEFDDDEQVAIDTELSRIAPQLTGKSIRQSDLIRIENGMAARALYRLAHARYQNQHIEGAFSTLYKSMAMDSSYEGQWVLLANIYAETNRVADAKQALRFAEEQFAQTNKVDVPTSSALVNVQSDQDTWASQIATVKKKIEKAELDGGSP